MSVNAASGTSERAEKEAACLITSARLPVSPLLLEQSEEHGAICWIDWNCDCISSYSRYCPPVVAQSNRYRVSLAEEHETGIGHRPRQANTRWGRAHCNRRWSCRFTARAGYDFDTAIYEDFVSPCQT